ncbi:peptidase S8 family [Rhizoctonia solani]|uniref:Peptidase S8 family n=1 Tax=Rhizoctonia solani TaxID=456999 RepID=A0A8H7IN40_9AGAM|nr:peptidase S8 family [Rhizoctonia solani]
MRPLASLLSVAIAIAACVTAAPIQERQNAYSAYMFAYFTGEGYSNGETISFAVSNGNDALHWTEVNRGNPYLTSTLGTKGVRDPSIIRAHDGSKFWLLATDLKMYGSGDWNAAVRTGSRSIVIWESTDLKNWGTPRLVQVSPATAGNTWAPEAIWDPSQNKYVVFWASSLYAASDTAHTGSSYHRILRATTTDFKTFSAPEVYIDKGWAVIDTTFAYDSSTATYYRFSKDERANSSSAPNGKFVFQEKGSSISGSFSLIKEGVGKGSVSRGEGPTVFKSNTESNKWYMFIDEFGDKGRGYVPFETTNIASGAWTLSTGYSLPSRPRHGSVIPISAASFPKFALLNRPESVYIRVPEHRLEQAGPRHDEGFLKLAYSITASLALAGAVKEKRATYSAYMFAYFTGEGYSNGETISFAVSNGNSPLNWTEVHGGTPYLTSTVGTGVCVIHPSLDLRMVPSFGCLQPLVEVSPPTAGNTWAPEAIWDPQQSAYIVFWASSLYAANDTAHTGTSYHRILRSTTTDFKSFTPAQVYIDYGWSVIDTTMVRDTTTGTYYRFNKDERSPSSNTPDSKFIAQEKSSSVTGTWSGVVAGIGKGVLTRGEGPTVFKSNTEANKWHMFIDEYGGRGYVPFETTNIAAGTWAVSTNYALPSRPRHGSVIPITEAERQVLLGL